jgi:hypothetical protein
MTSIDFVAANAQAVALLHQEDYYRAIRGLQGTMKILKNVSSIMESRDEFMADDAVDDVHIQASQDVCKLCNRNVQESFFSFCARPMLLVGTHDQVMRSAENQNRAASVLLYNLSLAYLCSSGCCCETDLIMSCSLKICSMASDLISRLPRPNHGDTILYVSSLNNQGLIHVYFASHEAANDSMMRLETTLAALSTDEDEYGLNLHAYKDVNDVICSVLWCQGRPVMGTAPAA